MSYPFSFFSIIKENIYFLSHRIFWLALLIPSNSLRIFFLKITGAKIGKNVSILSNVKIIAPWNLTIGMNSTINSNSIIDCRGKINIGSNTMIGRNVSIHSVGHSYNDPHFSYKKGIVTIEKGAIIYPYCFIGPNIKIGEFSVVLPNSWVNKNINKNEIVSGNPAKKIGISKGYLYSHYNPSIFGL